MPHPVISEPSTHFGSGTTIMVMGRPTADASFLTQIRCSRKSGALPRVLTFHNRTPRSVRLALDSLALAGDDVDAVNSPSSPRPWVVIVSMAGPSSDADLVVITWPVDVTPPDTVAMPSGSLSSDSDLSALYPDARIECRRLTGGASSHWAPLVRACALPVTDPALTKAFA